MTNRNLSEIQNYLEFLYLHVDNKTEKVEITVDVFQDLRHVFNSAICLLYESSKLHSRITLAMLFSLFLNLFLVFLFLFKI